MPSGFLLRCNVCAAEVDGAEGYPLTCCATGLLDGVYPTAFSVDHDAAGLWRFASWLPVAAGTAHRGTDDGAIGGCTYRSEALGAELGLDELWVSFNGWWPERGARCPTCSFKDLEVAPTLGRLRDADVGGVVVATAGNTGRAFAHQAASSSLRVVIVVAERHLDRIWREASVDPPFAVLAVRDGDYNDAIDLAPAIADRLGFALEGGVHNVARRDGIGTLLLDAFVTTGAMPDHYVQAVGGGPGPIGVAGQARRLVGAGLANSVPTIHLAQNERHRPVDKAWSAGRAELVDADVPSVDPQASGIEASGERAFADVLVNRRPAYGLKGGLRDVLQESNGHTYSVSEQRARHWGQRFETLEGIDIMEAPSVAVAALEQAVATGAIGRSDRVLLGVTGGGEARRRTDTPITTCDAVIGQPAELLAHVDSLVGS